MKVAVIVALAVIGVSARSYEPYQSDYPQVSAQYGFSYDVKDTYSNVDLGHQENRDGDDIKGAYNVMLPDGRRQVVNYYVNGYSGFVADVEYQGEAKYPEGYPKASYPSYPKPSYEPTYPKESYPKPSYEPSYPKSSYEPSYPKPSYEPSYPKESYPKSSYEPSYPKPSYEPSYPTKPTYATKPSYTKTSYEPTYPKASYEAPYATKLSFEPSYPSYPTTTYRPSYPSKATLEASYPSYPAKTTYKPYSTTEEPEMRMVDEAVKELEPIDEATITKTMLKPLFRDEAEAMKKAETSQ